MNNYLAHHGVLGMKWGVRRYQNPDGSLKPAGEKRYGAISIKAGTQRALAKVYGMNERVYAKSNKTLSSMNAAAKEKYLKKAAETQKAADQKKAAKIQSVNQKREAKRVEKEKYKTIDADLAKNKQTRRAAMDYNNMTNLEFAGKYKTTKKTFAKRFEKTKGDTYSLGKKKALLATALIAKMPPQKVAGLTVTGKAAAAKALAYDFGSAKLGTDLGYKNAERIYKATKNYKES